MLGIEPALKLVVIAIPVLTALGLVLVAVGMHGRATPFVAFALPLAYGYPFHFGFLNFCLSVALALIALAGWMRLGRAGRPRLRAAAYVFVSIALWICHVFGWAVLLLMVVAVEWGRRRAAGVSILPATWRAAVAALPLVPPIALMLAWRSGAGGETGAWLAVGAKIGWLTAMLRDRWEIFDRTSAALLGFLVVAGAVERRVGYARIPRDTALALLAAYVCLPFVLFGSAFADMRLAPLMVAVALVALNAPSDLRWAKAIALLGLAFFATRTIATTASFALYDRAYPEQLGAVIHISRGARVIAFIGAVCLDEWKSPRMEHLGGLATVRRDAFVNDQWAMKGAQLLTIIHDPEAGDFQSDPSQLVKPERCRNPGGPVVEGLIPAFPAKGFDYLWLINLPGAPVLHRPGLQPVWTGRDGALFRIGHRPSDWISPAKR